MYDVVGSIVLFKNDREVAAKAIESFLATDLKVYLYIVDNSPTDRLRETCQREHVEYVFNNRNAGFGAGHNIALQKMTEKTRYCLIMNPDITFERGTLETLVDFMDDRKEVGSLLPKVLYPDHSMQYLCRLIPNPYDVFIRKFNFWPFASLISARKQRNELRFTGYNRTMNVPYLSGCFMFVRAAVFEKIGLFDERYFLYFEDVDLARRIHKHYQTLYYPKAVICHGYSKGSDKSLKLLQCMLASGIKYFNKWGWFFDGERKLANSRALNACEQKQDG